jgi:hypothetical protein
MCARALPQQMPTTGSNRLPSRLQAILCLSLASSPCGALRMVVGVFCFGCSAICNQFRPRTSILFRGVPSYSSRASTKVKKLIAPVAFLFGLAH